MRAEIVSIGTELLLGTITDTNASYLAQRLAGLGIDCYYISQVGDNMDRLREVLQRAWSRSNLIVTTGGLGPTADDITREAIAEMLGEQLVVDEGLAEQVRGFFRRRGADMPERNLKQASLIPSAAAINNPVGTAPGWWVSRPTSAGNNCVIVSMPGVPFEMKRMWEREVEPRLRQDSETIIVSRTLKVLGMGESAVEQAVIDLMSGANPTLAPYAKQDGVHLRITAKATSDAVAREIIAPVEADIRERLGIAVYGADDDTPGGVVLSLLHARGLTLAVLEIGEGALAAVSLQLGADKAVRAVDTACDAEQAMQMLGAADTRLQSLAASVIERSGADVALAIEAHTTVQEQASDAVQAEACIFAVFARSSLSSVPNPMRGRWTTTRSEVSRLVGLTALNHLRLALEQYAVSSIE